MGNNKINRYLIIKLFVIFLLISITTSAIETSSAFDNIEVEKSFSTQLTPIINLLKFQYKSLYAQDKSQPPPKEEFIIEHHSHPTMFSLQGKVTNSTGGLVNNGNLAVNVSTSNSCSNNVFFSNNFVNSVQNGIFNILLGDNPTISLDYNKDYYLCTAVNDQLVSGPTKFRGGQGQVQATHLNSSDNYVFKTLDTSAGIKINGTTDVGGFKMSAGASNGYILTSDASGIGTWQASTGGINGSGTANYIPKFTAPTTIGNSVIYDNGTSIGIGTTNPKSKLHVNDEIRISDSYSLMAERKNIHADAFILHNAEYSSGNDNLKWTTTHSSFGSRGMRFNYLNGIYFYADSVPTTAGANFTPTTRMFIRNDGYIGIGTSSPSGKLHADDAGTLASGSHFLLKASSGAGSSNDADVVTVESGRGDGFANGALLNVKNIGGSKLYVRGDGRIGVGTANPADKLDVNGSVTLRANATFTGASSTLKIYETANGWVFEVV